MPPPSGSARRSRPPAPPEPCACAAAAFLIKFRLLPAGLRSPEPPANAEPTSERTLDYAQLPFPRALARVRAPGDVRDLPSRRHADRHRDTAPGRQRRRRCHRHRRRAVCGRAADDRHRRRLLRADRQTRPQETDSAERLWTCSCGRDGRVVRRPGHQAHRDHLRACRDGARRHRWLVPPRRRPRQHAARSPAGTGHRAGRGWLRGRAACGSRLGQRRAQGQAQGRRRQEAPAERRQAAQGRTGLALSRRLPRRSRPSPPRAAMASMQARWRPTSWPS